MAGRTRPVVNATIVGVTASDVRMPTYDIAVIGGGTAGMTAALAASSRGKRVVLVERDPRLGGDCTFYGCVPSKALIGLAKLAHDTRQAAAAGVFDRAPALDFAAVQAESARIVEEIARDERDERFTDAGVDVLHGTARFNSQSTVEIDGEAVTAAAFVIATGSEPAVPPIEGLETVPYLTNRTIFSLTELPRRLLILGGGAIGLELAQAFQRFGSEVVVVEQVGRLLVRDEPEAGALVADVLTGEGVDLRLDTKVLSARQDGPDAVLTLEEGEIRGDALLVAAGRRANVQGLDLDVPGVTFERGYVAIDEHGRTSLENVYAAGDVTGGLQFTHVAAHEGRVAALNAAGKRAKLDLRVAPWVTFTDPEVAHVGLTEAEARERHDGVRIATYPMARVDRARIERQPVGFVKLVTAKRRVFGRLGGGELVGAQVVGPRAGELIQECALAMQTRSFAGRLTQTIHPYPSMSVAVQQAAAQLFPLGRLLAERDP